MKRQVQPMIIVENKIHRIIELQIITYVNIIIIVEQKIKCFTEIIMIGNNNIYGSIHSGTPTPEIKQVPVIPFGDEQKYRGGNPTFSSGSSLKI